MKYLLLLTLCMIGCQPRPYCFGTCVVPHFDEVYQAPYDPLTPLDLVEDMRMCTAIWLEKPVESGKTVLNHENRQWTVETPVSLQTDDLLILMRVESKENILTMRLYFDNKDVFITIENKGKKLQLQDLYGILKWYEPVPPIIHKQHRTKQIIRARPSMCYSSGVTRIASASN